MTPEYESKFYSLVADVKKEIVKIKVNEPHNYSRMGTTEIKQQYEKFADGVFSCDKSMETKEGRKLIAMIARFMIETL